MLQRPPEFAIPLRTCHNARGHCRVAEMSPSVSRQDIDVKCSDETQVIAQAIDALRQCGFSGSNPWALDLGLLLTAIAAAVTLGGIAWTVIQRHGADKHIQVWNRINWMLESAWSKDEEQKTIAFFAIGALISGAKESGFRLTPYDQDLLEEVLGLNLPPEVNAESEAQEKVGAE